MTPRHSAHARPGQQQPCRCASSGESASLPEGIGRVLRAKAGDCLGMQQKRDVMGAVNLPRPGRGRGEIWERTMRQPSRALAAALLLGSVVLPAPAETSERLLLSDVIAEVRDHNPDIKAAGDRVAAAKAKPAQVSAYDDPMISCEAWNAPESFRVDHADNNIFRLSQKIPFPGKRSLAGTMAERDAAMAEQNLRSVELDAIAAATRAYYDLWMVHQDILIYSRDKDLVERFAKIAEQKYVVGQVSEPDVLRAQVELTRLINRVTTETLAADSARAALNALLSRAEDGPLGLPEDPPPPALEVSLDDLVVLALGNRPELAAHQVAIAR